MRPTTTVAIYRYTHHSRVHRGYVSHVLAFEEQADSPTPHVRVGSNFVDGGTGSCRVPNI